MSQPIINPDIIKGSSNVVSVQRASPKASDATGSLLLAGPTVMLEKSLRNLNDLSNATQFKS